MRAWWYMAQVHAERLGMSDHSWVHTQIVLNIALRLLRLLVKAGVEPAVVADHGMSPRDAEVVVAGGALLHDVGMSIHRADHEAYSLFLANGALERLLAGPYRQPERTIVAAEILHAIIGHRRRGEPYTLEAGVVRVADALDMAQGRTRLPIEAGQEGIHSISAAAVDEVRIEAGETARCGSRSSSTTRPASSRSTTCWRRRSATPRWRARSKSWRRSRARPRSAC